MAGTHSTALRSALAIASLLAATSGLLIGALAVGSIAAAADPAAMMGCGNIVDLKAPDKTGLQFDVLREAGVESCRIPVYPYDYYWSHKIATPERLDALMLQAHDKGITPILLFEYYTRFNTPVGDQADWRKIGKAFADRFRPNSQWWLSNGVRNFGVTVYSAFNEPDIDKPLLAPQVYHDALKGLADGVHDAGGALRVQPGGMAGPNSHSDYTCAGLGPAIADLENDGTLDGIDLHTYNGKWAPLADHRHSAQHDFDAVKKAWGVTRDVGFYCTEFNYQRTWGEPDRGDIGDAQPGQYLLTMTWDNLGVVGATGVPVTRLAFAWNLFTPDKGGDDENYAMCKSFSPWVPNARGAAYQMVASLSKGMEFENADPRVAGTFVLSNAKSVMWVWQDRPNWTTFPGATCLLTGVPRRATQVLIYGYDGLRETVPLKRQTSLRITDLPGNETYLFIANASDKPSVPRAIGP